VIKPDDGTRGLFAHSIGLLCDLLQYDIGVCSCKITLSRAEAKAVLDGKDRNGFLSVQEAKAILDAEGDAKGSRVVQHATYLKFVPRFKREMTFDEIIKCPGSLDLFETILDHFIAIKLRLKASIRRSCVGVTVSAGPPLDAVSLTSETSLVDHMLRIWREVEDEKTSESPAERGRLITEAAAGHVSLSRSGQYWSHLQQSDGPIDGFILAGWERKIGTRLTFEKLVVPDAEVPKAGVWKRCIKMGAKTITELERLEQRKLDLVEDIEKEVERNSTDAADENDNGDTKDEEDDLEGEEIWRPPAASSTPSSSSSSSSSLSSASMAPIALSAASSSSASSSSVVSRVSPVSSSALASASSAPSSSSSSAATLASEQAAAVRRVDRTDRSDLPNTRPAKRLKPSEAEPKEAKEAKEAKEPNDTNVDTEFSDVEDVPSDDEPDDAKNEYVPASPAEDDDESDVDMDCKN